MFCVLAALDRIRAEFRSDTESLAQSEAALSLPDDGAFADGVSLTPTYQRGSQITLGRSSRILGPVGSHSLDTVLPLHFIFLCLTVIL